MLQCSLSVFMKFVLALFNFNNKKGKCMKRFVLVSAALLILTACEQQKIKRQLRHLKLSKTGCDSGTRGAED